MSTDNTRIFECFKAGTHTSMGGMTKDWTFADLEQICKNYLYRTDRAPLVIGHPVANGPAYGEVTELFHKRGRLYAVAKVGKDLLDLVKRGYYKHVSASFIPPSGLPGWNLPGWNLRHIGFLGAHPPAVRGLAPLAFGEMTEAPGTVCFAAATGANIAPPPPVTIPNGWTVTPEGWAFYERAREVHQACPALSFAEAASLAEKHILQF